MKNKKTVINKDYSWVREQKMKLPSDSMSLREDLFIEKNNPLLKGLSENELSEVFEQLKEIYSSELVQNHLSFLDAIESGVYKVKSIRNEG